MTKHSTLDKVSRSLLWGEYAGSGPIRHLISPVDQTLLQTYCLLTEAELHTALSGGSGICTADATELAEFAQRLSLILKGSYALFLEATQKETGFNLRDSREIVEGAIEYAWRFPCEAADIVETCPKKTGYRIGSGQRVLHLQPCPWGMVALILPQNAFLLLAVTGMLNALAAGNRVVIRPPLQSARSASLFSEALQGARVPQNACSLVFAKGRDFIAAVHNNSSPCLIHFLGSSKNASDILADAFLNGKASLVDGDGNGWAWVDRNVDVKQAVDVLTLGALRYNGQTCTSLNGAIIHPAIYPQIREELITRWKAVVTGNPVSEDVEIGPLFDVKQAELCQERLARSGADILCGNRREANLLSPTLAENPLPESELVKEGLFGPALWIEPGDRDAFVSLWRSNRYPLSATVLSQTPDTAWWIRRLPNLARLTVNGDPTEEYLFAPWGGYPASGSNRVGSWLEKYQRPVQVDAPDNTQMEAVRCELECLYARYVELLYSNDIPAILEMLAPDYILECVDGTTMDLRETEKLLKEQCASLDLDTTLEIVIENLTFENAAAAATVTEKFVNLGPRKLSVAAVQPASERLQENWVFAEGTWKINRTIVLP